MDQIPDWVLEVPVIDAYGYCQRYEKWWLWELDKDQLSKPLREELGEFFRIVGYYNPFVAEREIYSGFKSEIDIQEAVRALALRISTRVQSKKDDAS